MAEAEHKLAKALEAKAMLEQENKLLRARISELTRKVFGSSSEKLDPAQLELLLDPEAAKKPSAAGCGEAGPAAEGTAGKPRKRSKRSRLKKSIENLPTTREVTDPDEVAQAPHLWKHIGEEVTEELHYEPARYWRHLHIRNKYARREESLDSPNMAIAPLPPRLLEGSVLTPTLLAGITSAKYCWHLPLYRQEQMMRVRGIDCHRSLMCHWMNHAAFLLKPLYDLQKQTLLTGDYLQIDETPIDYLDPGRGSTAKGYLWTLNHPANGVYYEWHTGRAHKHLLELMENGGTFTGILQHDAYQPYLTLAKDNDLAHTACMAHIRRKFEKALKDRPAVAGWFMRHFARLYQIEAELRDHGARGEQRSRRRRRHSRPILNLLQKAVQHLLLNHRTLPRSPLGKALAYAHGQLPHMGTWIENGQVEIDNNLIENTIRPTKLGAKNWLFFGSAGSGKQSAILYTLVENVRRLNRDPYAYLAWVFEQIRLAPTIRDWSPLLPNAWAAAYPEAKPLRKTA